MGDYILSITDSQYKNEKNSNGSEGVKKMIFHHCEALLHHSNYLGANGVAQRNCAIDAHFTNFFTLSQRALYETLLGKKITEQELEQLFRVPWKILSPITQITKTLDVLRKAIVEMEAAA